MRSRTSWLALAVTAVLASACAREHLNAGYGRASREAFQAQRARPDTRAAPAPSMALDAQEAQVIGKGYLQTLAGKQAKADAPPVLFVAPPEPGAGSRHLAPSVPKE